MTEPAINPALIAKHGLTPEEYARIETILGRAPNFTELGVFSVMWSEHCSYKNSRPELRKFPTEGPRVLVKAGEENAGVIDIGRRLGGRFQDGKPQSPERHRAVPGRGHRGRRHHPRYLHNGSAARVFSLNSLRFGPIAG